MDYGLPNLTLHEWNEGLVNDIGARPEERRGLEGGFTHGVTIFRGGVPHHKYSVGELETVNRGTVLGTFPNLKPNMNYEESYKPGTAFRERQGMRSMWRMPRKSQDQPIEKELDHGKVLHHYPHLKPDLSWEVQTNVVGGRPMERRGVNGGFKRGRPIWSGGCARDMPMDKEIMNHGTILFRSSEPHMMPDRSHLPAAKIGTEDERSGRHGSFEHGDPHLHFDLPTREQWMEKGQVNISRRCSQGHFASGCTVMAGGSLGPKGYYMPHRRAACA